MSNIDLKGRPFYLNEEDISWVEKTKETMTLEEKIGQLFCNMGATDDEAQLKQMVESFHPGGLMYRPMSAEGVAKGHRVLQENSKIPMFLAANLEKGGDGLVSDLGTVYGSPMSIGATDDETYAYRLGAIAGREASAVGGNMAFAPIIDINFNFRNPITNIRSFGDDPKKVAKMGAAYVRGAIDNNICVTIKHFPGDGADSRDQHLITTINNLSAEDWLATYGEVYKASIEAGARGLMVGHIALPSYVEKINPNATEKEKRMPGTLNSILLNDLLRDELGYNGLTMTDASLMTGFGQNGKRRDLVPQSIAAGCDMFLFTRNYQDDFNFMMDGYKNGVITEERLDDALTRILALKASLKLHTKTIDELVPNNFHELNLEEHKTWAKELADKSVTLVKDEQNLLPISPEKNKKIGLVYFGNPSMVHAFGGEAGPGVQDIFAEKLKSQGFEASFLPFDNLMTVMMDMQTPMEEWSKRYDVIIYLLNKETMSNQTALRPEFKAMGFDAPWFVEEVPTVLISLASPYHAFDFDMVKTQINAYTANDASMDAVIEKIMGKSEFKGISPVRLDFKEFTGTIN